MMGLVNALNNVFFIDAQTGWAVGEKGTILHTEDGGETWRRQFSGLTSEHFPYPVLQRVFFANKSIGWIMGTENYDDVVLLQTSDAGRTWTRSKLPIDDRLGSFDMTWVNELTGWLLLDMYIFHTTDGGQTWNKQAVPQDLRWGTIYSVDQNHVWVLSNRNLARTTDGGITWTTHELDFWANKLDFVAPEIGWGIDSHNIFYTSDGGQTWENQFEGIYFSQLFFLNAQIGWVLGPYSSVFTKDGGQTWTEFKTSGESTSISFVDELRGWAVDTDYSQVGTTKRIAIATTGDGGITWQSQDKHIEMSPTFYTSVTKLTPYLAQKDAPIEALVVQLVNSNCGLETEWITGNALHNLGWNGEHWGEPTWEKPIAIQRLDTDLDRDGEQEIVLYGGGESSELFWGVLDWDGRQWQTSWFETDWTRYSGKIRATTLDWQNNTYLSVETLTHPYSGTGLLGQSWTTRLIHCKNLQCKLIWWELVGASDILCNIYGQQDGGNIEYQWWGSQYRFVDTESSLHPTIELYEHGLVFDKQRAMDPVSSSLEVQVWPSSQIVYSWDDTFYTKTERTDLVDHYILNTSPVTETLDVNGDGAQEQVVYSWEADCDGFWQTLSIYSSDKQARDEPIQTLKTLFTGHPQDGFSFRDVDGDGQTELIQCAPTFTLTVSFEGEWPSFEPICTTYHWDAAKRQFTPRH